MNMGGGGGGGRGKVVMSRKGTLWAARLLPVLTYRWKYTSTYRYLARVVSVYVKKS